MTNSKSPQIHVRRKKNTNTAGKGSYFTAYLFKNRKAITVNTYPSPILMVMLTTKYIPLKKCCMNIAEIEDSIISVLPGKLTSLGRGKQASVRASLFSKTSFLLICKLLRQRSKCSGTLWMGRL